jgi:hypothetical protein
MAPRGITPLPELRVARAVELDVAVQLGLGECQREAADAAAGRSELDSAADPKWKLSKRFSWLMPA